MVLTCIDICVVMVTMFLASTEATDSNSARKRQSRKRDEEDDNLMPHPRLAQMSSKRMSWSILTASK
jgi:hypothetical protein